MDLLLKMKDMAPKPAPKRIWDDNATCEPDKRIRARMSSRDKSVPASDQAQRDWRPPAQVLPVVEEDDFEQANTLRPLGKIDTDAALYVLPEENNGETKYHRFLKLPSRIPGVDIHSRLSASIFNLLMVDVSGSMNQYWDSVIDGWNNHVAPKLLGDTVIYTFSSSVIFRKAGTTLEKRYFDGGGTDLTGALQTIINEVYQCNRKSVNVFIITDGNHNSTGVQPSSVIDIMEFPLGKICNIFILGVGSDFPVEYSVDIRSRLHSGSPNLPALFWAKDAVEVVDELKDVTEKMYNGFCFIVELSLSGSLLPGGSESNVFHMNEYVYMPYELEQLQQLEITFDKHVGNLVLEPQEATIEVLKEIFHQWNSIIIQRHRKREAIPENLMILKERLFRSQIRMKGQRKASIKQRMQNKELKAYEVQFRQELRQLNAILVTEKFENPLELAQNILSTTVTRSKYKTRTLQLRGHTDEDYEMDRVTFLEVLSKNKLQLNQIVVTPDDCCRVTMSSTITDLQDPDFPNMLLEYDKFIFLKTFTVTGIPVFAPTRDSVSLNPWSYSVKKILKSPYTIMSQSALESFGDLNEPEGEHKVVKLKHDDENSSYNAVVPVFPPTDAKIMKPFVKTRLYTMCVTFAITKNPHIISFDIHVAALAVTWARSLYESPTEPRPEHVQLRMRSIEATAALYMEEKRYRNYCTMLVDNTPQALMTESTIQVENKPLNCESLVKPVFLLHMMKNVIQTRSSIDLMNMMKLILAEYIGRCLSSYKVGDNSSKPYSDFFAESFADESSRKKWVRSYIKGKTSELDDNERVLLEHYYTLEKVSKAAKKMADIKVNELQKNLLCKIPVKINIEKVERLRNVSSAGDISWFTLRVFAHHIGLSEEEVNCLFSEQSVFIYTSHALRHRSSRDRMSYPLDNFDASYEFVSKKVSEESSGNVIETLRSELISLMEKSWLKAYFDAHSETVRPMTRQQIISEAQNRGIAVSEENFDQVYRRFRPTTGLLSNACQTRACPYFLQPNKSYNQHASVERKKGGVFVHALHKAAYSHQGDALNGIVSVIRSGILTKEQTPVPEYAVQKLASEIEILKVSYQEMAMGKR
ncbi:uncharacterized protein [Palaemon carinicauda]|uniref:uncharacterized protein n=1 Tax=Palaemon carinicauda TaxID=392227 RepID=UPI0035B63B52